MKHISIDEENSGERFWAAIEAKAAEGDFTANVVRQIEVGSPHCTSHEKADDIERWCETVPGWTGGPEHAPHPLVFDAAERTKSAL